MATANNCNVPEDLWYWVKEHVWIRPEDDGTAGNIITATPKKTGRKVKKAKSAGTVESSKWVGPVRSPVNGEIVASNEAVANNPKLLNEDPYGAGWFVRVQPTDWDGDKADLVTGAQAVADYEAFLTAEGIDCGT
jgi:glycine cleavage system H protein